MYIILKFIYIGTYERALKEQGSADVAYARLMLLGSAGTGKTSLKRSLMEEPFDPHTTSTIVSDVSSVRPFGHKWQTMRGNKWKEATEKDEIEELAHLLNSRHSRPSSHHTSVLSAEYSHDESVSTSSIASDLNVESHIESILISADHYRTTESCIQVSVNACMHTLIGLLYHNIYLYHDEATHQSFQLFFCCSFKTLGQ